MLLDRMATKARELLVEVDPEILFADGFDSALMGHVERCNQPPIAVYDVEKCIRALERQGMARDEAEEYFEFNVAGAWVGDRTPAWFYRIPKDR